VVPGHGAPFSDVNKALDSAFSRIDYFIADPVRNAQNAVKVLLKFLLLERQKILLTEVPRLLHGMRLFREANRRYFNQPAAELAQWTIAQLVRSGAAEVAGGVLMNRG
jgi:hypothetical protein